jgi:outer membrane protein OmpA-like peptidoglycan-associated protein
MKRICTLLAGLLAFAGVVHSQNMIGFMNTNYAGVYGIDFNPSSIVDSRFKMDVNVIAFDFGLNNSYAGIKHSAFKGKSAFGAYMDYRGGDSTAFDAFNDDNFQNVHMQRNTRDYHSVTLGTRVVLPLSFMYTFNDKNAFSITGEFRMMTNVDGISQELASFLYDDFGDSTMWNTRFTNERASIQMMTWHEIGFGYARVIKDDGANFWKVGVRPKLELGLGSMYFYAESLEYQTENKDSITIYGSNVQYGHSTNFDFPNGSGDQSAVKYNYSKALAHPGLGLDLGFTYEWRPNYQDYKYDMDGETNLWMKSKTKYELKAGFSITDIGWIKFDRAEGSADFTGGIQNWNFRDIELQDFDSSTVDYPIQALDDTLRKLFVFKDTKPTYRVSLPTAFRADVDYHIWNDFYVNLQAVGAIQWRKDANKIHELSYIAITPRYDYKWAGVMVPVSINQYKDFRVGTAVRLGPIFVGTSDMGAMFGKKKNISGANFYFGVRVPLYFKEPKDRDKDKVSDKKDKCIDTPGIWEFLGCPDRDGDHVQDSEDICPDEPGLKQFNGCPDRDNDQIIDKQDACPDEPGLQEFNGCPDKDGDKIIDKEDDCPDEAGLKEFKGCPDKDGDGVMDKIDICPEKPGPAENEGCPEVILSLVDLAGQSIKQAKQAKDGSFTYESLPADSLCVFRLDGDPDKTIGVNEVKVIVNGLPKRALRSQADGLFRFDIPKPVAKGLQKEVEVMPVLTKQEAEILKRAFDNLEFESGKAIIKATSYSSLDTLADLMKKKPEWNLKIAGHTDNVGKPTSNMKLSENRAKAVKTYLMSKGIDEKRLITEWYGQTRPIAPNTTPEGRQKNRRVEMLIIEKQK